MSDRPDPRPASLPPPPAPGTVPMPAAGQATTTNGMATASLVLGIIAVVLFFLVWVPFVLGVLATVFGAIGRSRAKQGAPNGGLATAGLVLGIVALVISALFFLLFFTAVQTTSNHVVTPSFQTGL